METNTFEFALPPVRQRIHGSMAQQRFHHLGPPAHMRRKPVLLLTESPKQTRLVNLFQNSKIHGSALCPLAMWCIQKRREKSQDIWQTWSNQIQLRLKKVIHSSRLNDVSFAHKKENGIMSESVILLSSEVSICGKFTWIFHSEQTILLL